MILEACWFIRALISLRADNLDIHGSFLMEVKLSESVHQMSKRVALQITYDGLEHSFD